MKQLVCSFKKVRLGSGSEAGSYLRLIDSCITQLKAQRISRTCNESEEEEEEEGEGTRRPPNPNRSERPKSAMD